MSDHKGYTDHEMIVEIRGDLKQHIEDSRDTELDISLALASRPTRAEILRWVAASSTLIGLLIVLS